MVNVDKKFKLPIVFFLQVLNFVTNEKKQELKKVSLIWDQIISYCDNDTPTNPLISALNLLNISDYNFNITQLSGGMTNKTFLIESGDNKLVLRVGGFGTSSFINRENEDYNARLASDYYLNVPIYWSNCENGSQLTRFFENSIPFSKIQHQDSTYKFFLLQIVKALKKLHSIEKRFSNDINIFEINERYLNIINRSGVSLPQSFSEIKKGIDRIKSIFGKYTINLVPSHNDTTPSNFLFIQSKQNKEDTSLKIIDWEYSGNNDRLWDLVYFFIESELNEKDQEFFLKHYFHKEKTDNLKHWINIYKPLICFSITLWFYTQLANESTSCDKKQYEDLAWDNFQKTSKYLANPEIVESILFLEENSIDPKRPNNKKARSF